MADAPAAAAGGDAVLAVASRHKARRSGGSQLSQQQIRATMSRAHSFVRSGHDKHRESGIIRIRVTVNGRGKASCEVLGDFAGTGTGFCIIHGVERLRFPTFSGPAVIFNYSYTLQ